MPYPIRPLALALLLGAVGCNPPDGVQSFAFSLAPGATLTLPGADQFGGPIRPFDFVHAVGRCSANLTSKSVTITVDGLLPPAAANGPYYRFVLLIGDEDIRPQSAPPPANHEEPSAFVDLGRIDVDHTGRATVSLINAPGDLPRVHGGRVELMIPAADGTLTPYPVLEGEVGNLADPVPQAAAPASGGHHH